MAKRTRSPWAVGQTNSKWQFSPYRPPPIPAGSYDPALDAQREAANRGLGDLQQDVTTQNTRDTTDYGLQREDIGRSQGRSVADLTLGGKRLDEDHQRNVQLLERQYKLLGDRQQEGANAAGVLRGGALLQAAAKRDENKGIERSALDTQYNRAKADQQTALGRGGEDAQTALGRLSLLMAPPDESNPLGGRSFQDRTTQLTRGQRENQFFGLDVQGQKAFQAAGAGYVPPQPGEPGGRPSGQGVDAQGNPFREVRQGGYVLRVDRTGRVIGRRRA